MATWEPLEQRLEVAGTCENARGPVRTTRTLPEASGFAHVGPVVAGLEQRAARMADAARMGHRA